MAQKRMIDKKISVSEQVANIPIEAQLLFTWMIPHSDDLGLLPYSPRTIKALIVPMLDISVETIGNHLESIREEGLIEEFHYKNDKFWKIINFTEHQMLKRDRNPQTLIKFPKTKGFKENWNNAISILESNGIQVETEENRIEENRREGKGIVESKKIQKNQKEFLVSNECFDSLKEKFPRLREASLKRECESMLDWVNSNGKKKKDYLAFARNWIRKGYDEIPKKPNVKSFEKSKNKDGLKKLNKIKNQGGVKEIE